MKNEPNNNIEGWEERFEKMIDSIHFDAPLSDRDYKKCIDFIKQELTKAEQRGAEECLPFLKQYLSSLRSDWGIHPVQAVPAIYISPEQSLRNAADEIDRKKRTEAELEELINRLTNKE